MRHKITTMRHKVTTITNQASGGSRSNEGACAQGPVVSQSVLVECKYIKIALEYCGWGNVLIYIPQLNISHGTSHTEAVSLSADRSGRGALKLASQVINISCSIHESASLAVWGTFESRAFVLERSNSCKTRSFWLKRKGVLENTHCAHKVFLCYLELQGLSHSINTASGLWRTEAGKKETSIFTAKNVYYMSVSISM